MHASLIDAATACRHERCNRSGDSANLSRFIIPELVIDVSVVTSVPSGPAAWSALPENIRANQDCEVLRKQLKKLFTLAFNVH